MDRPQARSETPLFLRRTIVELHNASISPSEISRRLNISRQTVFRWLRREREGRGIENRPRCGRPRCTTQAQDDLITATVLQQPLPNAVAIKKQTELKVTPQTIRRRLHASGILHSTPSTGPHKYRIQEDGVQNLEKMEETSIKSGSDEQTVSDDAPWIAINQSNLLHPSKFTQNFKDGSSEFVNNEESSHNMQNVKDVSSEFVNKEDALDMVEVCIKEEPDHLSETGSEARTWNGNEKDDKLKVCGWPTSYDSDAQSDTTDEDVNPLDINESRKHRSRPKNQDLYLKPDMNTCHSEMSDQCPVGLDADRMDFTANEAPWSPTMVEWTRPSTMEFIELYKARPCLWQTKSESYKSRTERSLAVNEMWKQLKSSISNITVEGVRRKINTLRSQYRRELRQYYELKKSGLNDSYEPKLWCFEALAFLQEEDRLHEPVSTLDVDLNESFSIHRTGDAQDPSKEKGSGSADRSILEVGATPNVTLLSFQEAAPTPSTSKSEQKRKRRFESADDFVKMATEGIAMLSKDLNDESTDFAKVVASELRKMDKNQQCITKKIINEALFLGSMELFSNSAHVVNGDKENTKLCHR